jgi:hypothetical protein
VFLLNGQPLALDVPFESGGILYPSNWLRLATPDERTAAGITEVPDPPYYDQRFYWGYDSEGNLIPKDHNQLVAQWVSETRATANTLLFPTDWIIIRESDNGTPANPDTKFWREEIREACREKVLIIEQTTTTTELADYITGSDYPVWPLQDSTPEPPVAIKDAPQVL